MRSEIVWNDGDRAIVGFGLQRLRRPRSWARALDPVQVWARMLTALEGYGDITFVVELTGHPGAARGSGRLDVSLFAVGGSGENDRLVALAEDLADLLHVAEELFEFAPLEAGELVVRRISSLPVYCAG